jgi:hypothetical protein
MKLFNSYNRNSNRKAQSRLLAIALFTFLNIVGALAHSQTRVMDQNNRLGTIRMTFESGQVLVQFDIQNRSETHSVRSLIPAVECAGGLCRGMRVTNFLSQTGVITEVFENKIVRILLDKDSRFVLRKTNELTLQHLPPSQPQNVVL